MPSCIGRHYLVGMSGKENTKVQASIKRQAGPTPPRILVVEDEVLVRMYLAALLREAGAEVMEAGNGEEARTILLSSRPVDLIVTDLNMPGPMNGLGLARWTREAHPETKIAVISGDVASSEVKETVDAFYSKAMDPEQLREQILSLLVDPT